MSIYDKYLKLIKAGTFTETDIRYFRKAVNGSSSLPIADRESLRFELEDRIQKRGGIKITQDQTNKGITWLTNKAFKLNGLPRKSSPFGELENHIINNFKRFEFVGLFNLSDNNYSNYMPIYRVIDTHGHYFDYTAVSWGDVILVEAGKIKRNKAHIEYCRVWPDFENRHALLEGKVA